MRNFKLSIIILSASLTLFGSGSVVAGMFDALIESVTKSVVEQAVGSAANQAAQPTQAQPTEMAQPILQNGCYFNLPQLPPSAGNHQSDVDRNGCVDYNEMSMHMQIHQAHTTNAQPQQAAAPAGGAGFLGALAGGVAQQAISGKGASPVGRMSGPGGAWVGANMALATAGSAARGQQQQQQQQQPANDPAYAALAASTGLTPAEMARLGNFAQAKQAGMSNHAAALVVSQGGGIPQANNAANAAPYMANSQPMQVAMNNPQNTTGKDDLWEVVTKIDIPGMAIPPQANRVCAQAGKMRNEDKIPQDKNCSVLESRQTGDKYTFNMACEQNGNKMTGAGEVISGRDSYQGTVRTQSTAGGQAMSVTTDFSGRKVGNCTFGR